TSGAAAAAATAVTGPPEGPTAPQLGPPAAGGGATAGAGAWASAGAAASAPKRRTRTAAPAAVGSSFKCGRPGSWARSRLVELMRPPQRPPEHRTTYLDCQCLNRPPEPPPGRRRHALAG